MVVPDHHRRNRLCGYDTEVFDYQEGKPGGILVRQSIGAQILLVLIDYMTGFRGWSVNYAIPSLILFDVIAIVF